MALGATARTPRPSATCVAGGIPVPRGPRANSRAGPAGLTEREMKILLALAEGLSNAFAIFLRVLSGGLRGRMCVGTGRGG
jgi:hypothetical protein